jgi:hypothetical protein
VEDTPEKPAGELGKTLAPRPGQRPVKMSKTTGDPVDEATGSVKPAQNGAVPRVGQKPNRPGGGKRPPAKRPTQAKKRR